MTEPLNPLANEAAVLFTDLQAGIADLPLTLDYDRLRKGVRALAQLAKIFELPVIVSTVPGRDGGPAVVMPEIAEVLGTISPLQRTIPDSFRAVAIRQAIEATQRRTLIVSGVATEVAVQLPSLSAALAGYAVQVVVDACGGISSRSEDAALRRLVQAGVVTTSIPALIGELAGDFAEPKGQAAIGVLFELAGG